MIEPKQVVLDFFKLLNLESDFYRLSIEPLKYEVPIVANNVLTINAPKHTFRNYLLLEEDLFGNIKISYTDGTVLELDVYDNDGNLVDEMTSGYYDVLKADTYFILVNRNGMSKDELLKLDVLGETVTEIYQAMANIIQDGGLEFEKNE